MIAPIRPSFHLDHRAAVEAHSFSTGCPRCMRGGSRRLEELQLERNIKHNITIIKHYTITYIRVSCIHVTKSLHVRGLPCFHVRRRAFRYTESPSGYREVAHHRTSSQRVERVQRTYPCNVHVRARSTRHQTRCANARQAPKLDPHPHPPVRHLASLSRLPFPSPHLHHSRLTPCYPPSPCSSPAYPPRSRSSSPPSASLPSSCPRRPRARSP